MTTSKTASEQASAPRRMIGWSTSDPEHEKDFYHHGEHDENEWCKGHGCTPIERASASVGPMERRHPKLEALDAAAQDVFDNEGEIADRLIDQYSKAYNALADDLDAQARQIAALRGLLADTWCRGCNNRIGFTGDYSGEQRRYVDAYGNRLDWRTCHSCKAARVALEEPQGEAQ